MDTLPVRINNQSPEQILEDADREANAQKNGGAIEQAVVGVGLACAAGVGYFIMRKRRKNNKKNLSNENLTNTPLVAPAVTASAVTAPRKEIAARKKIAPTDDDASLSHQLIEFLKLLGPVMLAPDTPSKSKAATSDVAEPLPVPAATPADYLEDATPGVARIAQGTKWQQGWNMCKAAVNAWIDDFAPSMGAAIAYYTMFSIAPMLVIAIAVAGLIFGQEAAQGEIVSQLRGLIGTEGAIAIQGLLKSASEPTEGIIATTISIVTLAVGATAVFAELQSALDRIWRRPVAVKESGIWNLLRTRLLSFGLILGLGFMLMVSLVVSAALAALGNWWGAWFEGWEIMLQILNLVVSFFVFAGLFSVIYKFMPRVHLSWHDVWIGAVVTTLLFIAGKYLIGLYLGTAGVTSGFGAAGSFALLLLWIYYSAQIFLLGAEFTWIYANNYGSKSIPVKAKRSSPEWEIASQRA